MSAIHVSIRELKSRLSHYLRLTKAGDSVVITERGKPIGQIVPVGRPLEDRLAGMTQSGLVAWNGGKLPARKPAGRARPGRSVSKLLLDDRG